MFTQTHSFQFLVLFFKQFKKSNADSHSFVLEGERNNTIEINSNDGTLYTTGPLDWINKREYKLQVKTLDSAGKLLEGPFSVTIFVDDINDNRPQFNQSEYFGKVREQSRPGIPFLTVYATDDDDPSTPNAQLVYKIVQQIPNTENVLFFQINNNTGKISTTINGTVHLKADEKIEYELLLSVSDLGEKAFSSNAKVFITVTENLWKAPEPVNLVENSTLPHPHYITQVRWNDDSVIYELHQRERYPRFPFVIDQHGNINVTEPLDREERHEYIFFAVAKNNLGNPVARALQIVVNVADINDNPPMCPLTLSVFEVQENEDVGSTIGMFVATDNDEPGSRNSLIHYKLLEQWPKLPKENMFVINEYDGNIQLISGGLNIQDNNEYRLKVNVSDEGKPVLSNVCWILINVIDINDHIPFFEKSDYGNITLREDIPLNTLVKEIQARDDDQPQTGSSAIEYQIIEGDPNHMFIIETNPVTNRGYIKIAKPLDYESFKVHDLVIRAENPEPLVTGVQYNESSIARLSIIILDVDEKPVFPNPIYQAEVFEDVIIGTKIITIVATDPEGDEIVYSLEENPRQWLRIQENKGEISTVMELDREKENSYQVQVVAKEKNNPKMSSSVNFILYLKDVNDNPPRLAKDYLGDFTVCYPFSEPKSFEFQGTDDDYSPGTAARLSMRHTNFPKKNSYVPVIIQDNGKPALEATVEIPVLVCTCTSKNQCQTEPAGTQGLPSIGMALGILFGVLAVIGIILAAVFISLKKKNKSGQQDSTTAERERMNA
uniref:Cadherin domain-containing protein n=1 Tax=Pyxicephalus adspersus TaxID=30357 RepID=A0AAV3AFJ7_PYXAD|nr:TPA: hypothetical protein GDO54_011823 [Pyxicephalus adspersus]